MTPHAQPRPGYEAVTALLLPRLITSESGCWEWQGARDPHGYGRAHTSKPAGLTNMVHRRLWIATVGDIPDGMHLDHLCRNTRCANPDHLEVVTPRENFLRGRSPRRAQLDRTECPHGHPYTEANTIRRKGKRECRQCTRDRSARNRARRAALMLPKVSESA